MKINKFPLWWWLLVCVAVLLFFGPLVHAQDIYVSSCSTNYTCTITSNQPWATGNQTWIFSPIAPNVSIYVYLHNRNTTSAHTSQTLSIYQSGNPIVSNLSSNADQWAQDAVQQNSVPGASCNAVNANAPTSPGASGTGTCYVSTMATAQVALKMTGAALATGATDTFDISIVQISGYAAGPQPGAGEQQVSVVVNPTTPADNTSNTNIPGNQSFQMVFDGTNWDRATEPTADAVTNSGLTGVGPLLFTGTNYDRQRETSSAAINVNGIAASGPLFYDGSAFAPARAQSSSSVASSGVQAGFLPGVLITTTPADWSTSIEGTATTCGNTISAGGVGVRHCVTGASMCIVATIAQASLFAELKDGATLKWSNAIAGTAGTFACVNNEFAGGPICGTANTAMSISLSGSTGAGNTCTGSIKGYDVQ